MDDTELVNEGRQFQMRVLIFVAIVAAMSFAGCSQNTSSPTNVSRTQTPPPASLPADGHDHAAENAVERISILDARAAAERGQAIFVDVRQASAFQTGHIAGALSLPEAEVPLRGSSLPKGKKIITYCS